MKFAKRVQNLKPSAVFELLKKAKEMKKAGHDVISLSIGELAWDTYGAIKEEGKKAIDEGHTRYTPSAGIESLRKKISEQATHQYGLPIGVENVSVSAGCKYALFVIFQIFCDSGDEVILPAPYWMSYPDIIQLSGAQTVVVSTDESTGFKLTANQLKKTITSQTKMVLLNSPNNPTSAIYSEEELKSLGEVLKEHPKILVVTDDIYDHIVFSQKTAPHLLTACPFLADRVLALNGGSKNYLMTGWRVSWIIAAPEIIKTFSAFQSQSISCVNSIAQKAMEAGLTSCESDIQNMVQKLQDLRDYFVKNLKPLSGIKVFPSEGAFYVWVGVQDLIGKKYQGTPIQSSKDLMEKLLTEKHLVCLSGEEFGAPGYLRFSYGLEKETLTQAISRLSEFISELT